MATLPIRIDRHSDSEMLLAWSDGQAFAVLYLELRYLCPCASCVDEHTGKRVIHRDSLRRDVRPTGVELVGRYAAQVQWSDGHQTGIYHFDRLREICEKHGRKL